MLQRRTRYIMQRSKIETEYNFYFVNYISLICFSFASRIETYSTGRHKKKREILKNPTKIEEIQQKNFIDRNRTITTCLLRDSSPDNQCLKITSCRWRPPLRMHSFNLPLSFPIARCNISAGIPRI